MYLGLLQVVAVAWWPTFHLVYVRCKAQGVGVRGKVGASARGTLRKWKCIPTNYLEGRLCWPGLRLVFEVRENIRVCGYGRGLCSRLVSGRVKVWVLVWLKVIS